MMMVVFVLAGLALLLFGGEYLVRGSVAMARRLNVSELVIGLTLVGFGTSVPELVTSLQAMQDGAAGIAVGNVVGSNIANILLVLGAAALIHPIFAHPRALARDGAVMLAVTAVFIALLWFDLFTRGMGVALVIVLVIYLVGSLLLDRRSKSPAGTLHAEEAESVETHAPIWLAALMAVGGIAGVIIGARLLVSGGSDLARLLGVSETIIGLSIVAIGTSLPELVTSVMSALRGKADVALGNVIGSNIFNVLGILGVTAIAYPFSVRQSGASEASAADAMQLDGATSLVTTLDISTIALSVFLLLLFGFTGRRIARWEGAVLLGGYVLYLALTFGLIPHG